MEPKKRNIPLIVGIAIPIAMILFVAGSIYLPALFAQPKYNFLYSIGDGDYYPGQLYSVRDGRLVKNEFPSSTAPNGPPTRDVKFYVHDVAKNESTETPFDGAQRLKLDISITSPDGFEINTGSRDGGFFPFFYSNRDYYSMYLIGNNISKKLNVRWSGNYPYGSYGFRFLGWIIH